ncbi:MAG: hypothetical protein RLZZ360_490 [Candidatus Parcubacteria bacterium]|jgi:hypothetical protein
MIRFFMVGMLALYPALVLAQSDSFIIRTFIGSDTEAPTTPTGVAVTPMSSSQIDIVWSPVTDNFAVGGYRVARDGIHIATTSLTTFTDTGLLASTTYSYTIDAFDLFYNFSSTSLSVGTTTLPLTVPVVATTTPTDTTAVTAVPALRSFLLTPDKRTVRLNFDSYGPTRYIIRFGRTNTHELGSVSTNIFKTNHEVVLSGLEPGTAYYVELSLINNSGSERVVRRERFVTMAAITPSVPISAYGVRGEIRGDDIQLLWENPRNYDAVRVVRSHLFYPTDIYDGVTIYEGRDTGVVDTAVLAQHDEVFYAVFVIMPDGQVAAPAVLRVARPRSSQSSSQSDGGVKDTSLLPPPVPPDMSLSPAYERYLVPSDIFFSSRDSLKTLDSLERLPVDETIVVSIPVSALPLHLKTILVSLYHPSNHNEVATYLLKLRADGEAYEASLRTSTVVGEGKILVELYDYERTVVRRLSRTVVYTNEALHTPAATTTVIQQFASWWWLWLIPIMLGIGWRLLMVFRREDNR